MCSAAVSWMIVFVVPPSIMRLNAVGRISATLSHSVWECENAIRPNPKQVDAATGASVNQRSWTRLTVQRDASGAWKGAVAPDAAGRRWRYSDVTWTFMTRN